MTWDLWGYGVPGPGERTAALDSDLAARLHDEFHNWYDQEGSPTPNLHWEGTGDRGPLGYWPNVEDFLQARYPAAHKNFLRGMEDAGDVLDHPEDHQDYEGRVYETGPDAVAKYGYDPKEIAAGMLLLHNQTHPHRWGDYQDDLDRLTDIVTKRNRMQQQHDNPTPGLLDGYDASKIPWHVQEMLHKNQHLLRRCPETLHKFLQINHPEAIRTSTHRTAMPWYHVSPYDLPVGTRLVPGGGESPHGFDDDYDDPSSGYFSGSRSHVWVAPDTSWAGEYVRYDPEDHDFQNPINPFIYEVEPENDPRPLGAENDPNPGGQGWVTPSAVIKKVHQKGGQPHTAHRTAMPYYHNTDAELNPDDMLLPAAERGHKSRWAEDEYGPRPSYDPQSVYMYNEQGDPVSYAFHGKNRYEVEPVGEIKRDPEYYENLEYYAEELNRPEDHPEGKWAEWNVPAYNSYVAPRARVIRKLNHRTAMPAPLPEGVEFRYHPDDGQRYPAYGMNKTWGPGVGAYLVGEHSPRKDGQPHLIGYTEWFTGDPNHWRDKAYIEDGMPPPSKGEVYYTNVLPHYRRQSVATGLYDFARQHEPDLHHSENRTEDGNAWVDYEQSRHARRTAMPYYHTTDAELNPGDDLLPAAERGYQSQWVGISTYDPHSVYMTYADDDREIKPGQWARGKHTYEVEPVGDVARDPEYYEYRKMYEEELTRPVDHPEGRWDEEDVPSYDAYTAPRARVIRKLNHRTAMPTWHHLTNDPHFQLDPHRVPTNLNDHELGAGVFLTRRPEEWAYDQNVGDDDEWSGDRPYVADIDAPHGLHRLPGTWYSPDALRPADELPGSEEIFVPADQFHHLTVQQVRPRKREP